jgi:hypothetical protein
MRLIVHLPDTATKSQLDYLLLLAAKVAKRVDCVITQEVKVAGQLSLKVGAIAQTTKTGCSVKTWVEDLL